MGLYDHAVDDDVAMTRNAAPKHTCSGNCWHKAGSCRYRGCRAESNICDRCHRHDQPRGACMDCPNCSACDAAIEEEVRKYEVQVLGL